MRKMSGGGERGGPEGVGGGWDVWESRKSTKSYRATKCMVSLKNDIIRKLIVVKWQSLLIG